jgi:hypothetical protein
LTTDDPSPPFRNKRRRRARPSRARSKQFTEAKRAAKKQQALDRKAALEAKRAAAIQASKDAEAAKVEARKKQLAELANVQKELLNAARPPSLLEYTRARGIPDDVIYHPRYNFPKCPPETPMQQVENFCFARDWPAEYGGLGAFKHLQNFIKITWPDIQWNDWMERMLRSLCDTDYVIRDGGTMVDGGSGSMVRVGGTTLRYVNWVGCGSASKTFSAGLFACAWFMFDCFRGKQETSITLTSTSKGIIAQRVWPVIQKCYHEAKHADGSKLKWGHLVDSKKMVQCVKGDEKHSICAVAVEPGDLQASLDKIKGRHTPRMMVIVDEANSTPQAIFECIPNMLTSVTELIVLVIGNAGSRLDPHGRCCEPKRGWKSIGIEDDVWETKGVEQWGIGPGICLHFDGARSPNVLAGKTEHRHIYSFERWQQVLRMGEEYRNTLQHWSQDRGFWPPDGLQTTVFTEALVVSHDGMGKFDWIDQPKPCCGLDTAFGGDDCVYTPGLLGMVRGPKLALQLLPPVLVPFNPDSSDSIDYQIAQWFIARCKKDGVDPEYAGLDASGTGRGVAAFVLQLWSPRVHAVEFGGAASDMPASTTDPREGREVYSNKVTELWYSCRELLSSDQLKGLSEQQVKEFCSRTYEFVNRKYIVEPKRKMKVRIGYSPDYSDSVVVMVEVARRNGLKAVAIAGSRKSMSNMGDWEAVQREIASLATGGYTAANEFTPYAAVG